MTTAKLNSEMLKGGINYLERIDNRWVLDISEWGYLCCEMYSWAEEQEDRDFGALGEE